MRWLRRRRSSRTRRRKLLGGKRVGTHQQLAALAAGRTNPGGCGCTATVVTVHGHGDERHRDRGEYAQQRTIHKLAGGVAEVTAATPSTRQRLGGAGTGPGGVGTGPGGVGPGGVGPGPGGGTGAGPGGGTGSGSGSGGTGWSAATTSSFCMTATYPDTAAGNRVSGSANAGSDLDMHISAAESNR